MERAVARIDLDAVRANCARLKAELGEAELCAVVKADGYGHGADACAERRARRAARPGWRSRPRREAEQIGRRFQHVPLLTMGALTAEEVDAVISRRARSWRSGARTSGALVADRARAHGHRARVHVKYDSGMGRLGNRDPAEVLALARACADDPDLELAGVWTHFATADEPDSGLLRRAARPLRGGRRGGQGRAPGGRSPTPPTAPPSSATAAPTSTWPAAASPSTASTPSSATPPSTACGRRCRCAPTSPTSSASRPAPAPATGAGGRRRSTPGSG